MNETNDKSIRQIADELGFSKQTIRNQIAKLGLQTSLQKSGNQFAINKKQEALIIQGLKEKSQTENAKQSQSDFQNNANPLYDILRAELAEKNTIIKAQQQTIDSLTETIKEQAQGINADQQKQLAGQLIEGHKLISAGVEPISSSEPEPQKKQSFFTRLFRKD